MAQEIKQVHATASAFEGIYSNLDGLHAFDKEQAVFALQLLVYAASKEASPIDYKRLFESNGMSELSSLKEITGASFKDFYAEVANDEAFSAVLREDIKNKSTRIIPKDYYRLCGFHWRESYEFYEEADVEQLYARLDRSIDKLSIDQLLGIQLHYYQQAKFLNIEGRSELEAFLVSAQWEATLAEMGNIVKLMRAPKRTSYQWLTAAMIIFIPFALASALTTMGPVFALLSTTLGFGIALVLASFIALNSLLTNFGYADTLSTGLLSFSRVLAKVKRILFNGKSGIHSLTAAERVLAFVAVLFSLVAALGAGFVSGALTMLGMQQLPMLSVLGAALGPIAFFLGGVTLLVVAFVAFRDLIKLLVNFYEQDEQATPSLSLRQRLTMRRTRSWLLGLSMVSASYAIVQSSLLLLVIPAVLTLLMLLSTYFSPEQDRLLAWRQVVSNAVILTVLALVLYALFNANLAAFSVLLGFGMPLVLVVAICVFGYLGIVPFTYGATKASMAAVKSPFQWFSQQLVRLFSWAVTRAILYRLPALVLALLVSMLLMPCYAVAVVCTVLFTAKSNAITLLNIWLLSGVIKFKEQVNGKPLVSNEGLNRAMWGIGYAVATPFYIVAGILSVLLVGYWSPKAMFSQFRRLNDLCGYKELTYNEKGVFVDGIRRSFASQCAFVLVSALGLAVVLVVGVLEFLLVHVVWNLLTFRHFLNAAGNGAVSAVPTLSVGGVSKATSTFIGGTSLSMTSMIYNTFFLKWRGFGNVRKQGLQASHVATKVKSGEIQQPLFRGLDAILFPHRKVSSEEVDVKSVGRP